MVAVHCANKSVLCECRLALQLQNIFSRSELAFNNVHA